MIASFYDKDFRGLQNNASLVIDRNSYRLIKRPVEVNDLTCTCQAFTENIQPTFLVIKDDRGGYIYGSLAGVPLLNEKNQTQINGTDLKTMLSSDIIVAPNSYTNVKQYINYLFDTWKAQVNQGSFNCELLYNSNVGEITLTDLVPSFEKSTVVNALTELQSYLKFYNLYLDTKLDLVNKKIQFIIGRTMLNALNIKLWEYGIKNYGKWIADVNECQGYYEDSDTGNLTAGYKWLLTSQNEVTTDESKRDIYPIKRKVVISQDGVLEANKEALTLLLDSLFNEDIDIEPTSISPTFETKFGVFVNKGEDKYKDLPCGELQYDSNGLVMVKIGFRYTNINFI